MHDRTEGLGIRDIGISSVIYIVGDVLTRGISFLLIPFYTQVLTPAEYGNFGVLLSFISFLNILFSFQLGSALTVNFFRTKHEQRTRLISTIWLLILIFSVCMSILFLIGAEWVGMLFQGIANYDFLLVVGVSFFVTFSIVPQTLLRLRQQALKLVSVSVFIYLLGVVAGIFHVVRYDSGETGLLLGMFFANLFSVIPYIVILKNDIRITFSKKLAYQSLLISLPILPHMLSHWGLNLMDRVILQAYLPLSDVGIYHLGYQLGAAFQIIVIAINNAWTPFFLENFSQPSKWQSIKYFSSWLVFIQIWIALFLVLFLPMIVRLVFSDEYFTSAIVIPWVVLGFVFVVFYQYWINILLYFKKTSLIPIATGISALVNLTLNLVLVPRYGYIAAAINTVIGYAVLAGLTYFLAAKISNFSFEYIRWIKASTAGVIIFYLTAVVDSTTLFMSVLVKSILFFSFPLFLYLFSFWRRDELKNVYLQLRKRF